MSLLKYQGTVSINSGKEFVGLLLFKHHENELGQVLFKPLSHKTDKSIY